MSASDLRYAGYRFPPEIIGHAVWLYHRFCLSFPDAEDLLAQRGITVSYETIRQWCRTFGPAYARTLRRRRGRLGDTWYLDESFVKIQGRRRYLWRAVDQDGDVIDILVQSRRDRRAANPFLSETVESPRPRAAQTGHRQTAQLFRGAPHRDARRRTQHATVREQPSGGVASTDATTRGPDATVQVCGTRATLLVGARPGAESVWSRATFTAGRSSPPASNAGVRRMGCGDVCLLTDGGIGLKRGEDRPWLIKLTTPRRLIFVAETRAAPQDLVAVGRPEGMRVVPLRMGQPSQISTVRPDGVDVEFVIGKTVVGGVAG